MNLELFYRSWLNLKTWKDIILQIHNNITLSYQLFLREVGKIWNPANFSWHPYSHLDPKQIFSGAFCFSWYLIWSLCTQSDQRQNPMQTYYRNYWNRVFGGKSIFRPLSKCWRKRGKWREIGMGQQFYLIIGEWMLAGGKYKNNPYK